MRKNLNPTPRSERRQIQVIGRLTVDTGRGDAETCLCNTRNMSLSGVLVETGSELDVGSVIRYSFSLPGVKRIMEITGEVMRFSPDAGPGVGGGGRGGGSGAAKGALKPGNPGLPGAANAFGGGTLRCYGIKFLELMDDDRVDLERFLLS
jgi:hypothetical protein